MLDAVQADPQPNVSATESTELVVEGMTCSNCANQVREAIQKVPAVSSAQVQLEAGRATIRWQGEKNLPAVVKSIEQAGYKARENSAKSGDAPKKGRRFLAGWSFNVLLGGLCTAPMMAGEWVLHLGMKPSFQWIEFILAAAVQLLCGGRFFAGAVRQLKVGSSNMDTLVALGSSTAFGYSCWAFFTHAGGHLYFMDAAAIITLISLGHWIEARTSSRAESSLRALMALAPAKARRRNADGSDTELPVADVRLNDTLVLRPGDHVPVDGEAVEGEATVNEAMLTGESLPVEKKAGDKLFAGTVNEDGNILLRVSATGEGTALARIIAAVARAQGARADIQRLGDRLSSIFVPLVILAAIGTGLLWGLAPARALAFHHWFSLFLWPAATLTGLPAAFIHAAEVLIIACPCAMGLATPIAIMAGTNAAARRGFLIRDGVALERAGKITSIIFDKTGTLTTGQPTVAESFVIQPVEPADVGDPLQLAAALARRSGHPLSQAVAKLFDEDHPLTEWRELRGLGVQAKWAGGLARLGSPPWLRESGVDWQPGLKFKERWAPQGVTLLGLSFGQKLLAVFAVRDTLKDGVPEVMFDLQRAHFKVFLLTGDNLMTARATAMRAGMPAENVFADVRPDAKAGLIHDLQRRGEGVAFVGDGINDAPALEAADLGIAVSNASDIARAAADIVLLRADIQAVPEALGLARAALRTIKQNLFWAFIYNAIGIPLAALGFLSPILCALAMGLSDLAVIGNSLRLLRWKSFATKPDTSKKAAKKGASAGSRQ